MSQQSWERNWRSLSDEERLHLVEFNMDLRLSLALNPRTEVQQADIHHRKAGELALVAMELRSRMALREER